MGVAKQWEADVQTLGDRIAGLTVAQAAELSEYLEQVHGIKPAGGTVIQQDGGQQPQPQEKPVEKTEFNVVLESCDPAKKIVVIKTIREIIGLPLKESKDFVESLPKTVKEGVTKEEAAALAKKLEDAGGKVAIK